jgi:HEAT repeat protein
MAQKLICLLLTIVGGAFSYLMLLGPAFKVVQARWWTLTTCVITESQVGHRSFIQTSKPRGLGATTARSLQISYRYVVDKKEYESHRYSFLDSLFLSSGKMAKIVGRYSGASETTCYVNASNPSEAVLNRNFSSGMLLGFVPLLLFVIGVVGLGLFPGWAGASVSRWIDRQRARERRASRPAETPALGEIRYGFYAALALTGLGLFYLIAAIGDEFSNLSYLSANVLILAVLTMGYRRRVTLCALALVSYSLILLVSYFAFQFSPNAPSQAFSLILRFVPASLVPVLAQRPELPILFAAYVREVAPVSILMIPIAYFLFKGARRLLAERPAFPWAEVVPTGAVTAALLLSVIVASVQGGIRTFIPEPTRTPEDIMAALQGSDAPARKRACEAASYLDPLPTNLVPALIRAAKDGEAESRGACLAGLIHAGAEGKDAIPFLVEATKDASGYVRMVAAEALDAIGSKAGAPEALAAVLPLVNDPDDAVRRFATSAIREFGPQAREAVPLLRKALSDSSADVRGNAASALGVMASEAGQAAPELVSALRDTSEEVRRRAAEALGCIGPSAHDAVPALLRSFHDSSSTVRRAAIQAVAKIAPESPDVVAAMVGALKDAEHDVRGEAIVALEGIGPKAAPAVPALIEILSGPEIYLRVWAADTLAAIGPDARAAVPRLRQMLTEKVVSKESEATLLPEAVKKALYKIEGLSAERP